MKSKFDARCPLVLALSPAKAQCIIKGAGYEVGTIATTTSPKGDANNKYRVVRQMLADRDTVNLVIAYSPWD